MPKRQAAPLAVKNWDQIRSITFSEGCPTKYDPGKDGNFIWAACPEGDRTCTITFSNEKNQTHTVKRGGGVQREGTTVTIWEKEIFKCE